MDEIIAQVSRTIACRARLRLLGVLVREGELAPTQLAATLNMPLGLLCGHLRRLAAAGLLQRRRSGVWCYCAAATPYAETTLSGQLGRWLFRRLRAGTQEEPEIHEEIFSVATAFTNVRRLQIMRRLSAGKPLPLPTLSAALHMSEPAASRHLAKLVRRGYVSVVKGRWPWCYCLAGSIAPLMRREYLAIVRAHWNGGRLLQS